MSIPDHDIPLHPQAPLRSPQKVMRLERMGSFFPTRLSFMRTTIRRLSNEAQTLSRPVWEINDRGFGHAVYTIKFGTHLYSLIAFSNNIDPSMRTDRVIAEVWDSAFVLFDGIPEQSDIDRLRDNAPRQEAGRFSAKELVLSRANKSIRLFDHVTQRLAEGRQPDDEIIAGIGYLMRTTAVYGNGKFGIADRTAIKDRPALNGPFQAEMLTVWLIRNFTHDLVEHVAKARAPETAVKLSDRIKRFLGVGNSTGLGMAPFLVSHPGLLNNWMLVRETALARVCALETITAEQQKRLEELAARVLVHLGQWIVPDERQMQRIIKLRNDWPEIQTLLASNFSGIKAPYQSIIDATGSYSMECQELVVALLLEPHGDLIDGLCECMGCDEEETINPAMTTRQLLSHIEDHYDWALKLDLSKTSESQLFWYVSEEKLEPRLGARYEEEGAELELPHDIPKRIQALVADLSKQSQPTNLARFLMTYPHHRYIVKRVQTVLNAPYSEIHDNLVGKQCLPIDMLRCKLSFFGASKFDPKSDRWTRITLYQGAPIASDISNPKSDNDDWWLPVLDGSL